ncbi:hypothetical protein [Ornithinimicrobium pratense]|uniref:Uncharacterized protein n=1 Tax=Ornithinimicrobium pratense TaxID=2593973 RepID=A0A5J6V5J7_9MICO|nr:hypothetical protein [Ornithinimicrobium pratense]QFG68421.1 hypothetical protein FY030_06565 [Ornithinimicrobium pratense]
MTLYTQENEVEAGSWISPEPLQGAAQWRLDSSPEWVDSGEAVTLIEGKTYSMYGWTDDNSASTDHVTFTQADLDQLRPGQVRWGDPGRVTTLQEFASQACAAH